MPGSDEHEGYDVDAPVAGRHEAGGGVLDRRWGELEEASFHVGVRHGGLQPVHELAELGDARGGLRAVTDDEQGGSHCASV